MLQVGDVFDGFRLDEQLEPGGMADFWRVSKPGISLPLIMKIPLLRRGEDPLTIVGFEQEQMILTRLTGPHVPRFFRAGDFEHPYIVMEYVLGRSLAHLVDSAPLAAEEVAQVGASVAEALHDIQADPQPDLRQRLHGEHRQATRQVRALLQQQWTQNGG